MFSTSLCVGELQCMSMLHIHHVHCICSTYTMYTVHVHVPHHPHPGVLVILCLRVCTVRVWCIGSGFPFFSSSVTNLASVLDIHMYYM